MGLLKSPSIFIHSFFFLRWVGFGRPTQCARAPVILHKRRAQNSFRFVHFDYCNLRKICYNNNCQGAREVRPPQMRAGTVPSLRRQPRKNFSKKFEKPLDNPPKACYNKGTERERNPTKPAEKKIKKGLDKSLRVCYNKDVMRNKPLTNKNWVATYR